MTDFNNLLAEPEPDDVPPINKAIEDVLAMVGYDTESRAQTLHAWIWIGAEYLAREAGRKRAREILQSMDRFVRDAEPTNPWPE